MNAGSVIIKLIADATGVATGVGKSKKEIAGLRDKLGVAASGMMSAGKAMTRWITTPVVGAGAAAAKFSLDFNKSMTDLKAMVGMSSDEVAKFKGEILDLSGEVGRAPRELGEAFYYIASSGLEGESAMRALRASALASAAGLGDTAVIADAVTSAINAYGEEALSASYATDILMAAVAEGKNEPEELASSIGSVIPLAERMGISFDEVAGTMAALSLNGTNAFEAVTQINSALTSAIKPTKSGADALKKIGMTYADLRKSIKDKGLIKTFDALNKAFDGNVESLGDVFGNVRALRGLMTLTGPSMEKYEQIVRKVGKAHGDTAKAAAKAAEEPGMRIERAWARIQVVLIRAGDVIVPVIADIAEYAGKLADRFAAMSPSTQRTVVVMLGLAAALGPVLSITGSLIKVTLTLRGAYLALSAASAAAAASQGSVTAAQVSGSLATGRLLGETNALRKALPLMSTAGVAAVGAIGIAAGALLWKLKSIHEETMSIYADVDKQSEAVTRQLAKLRQMQRARPEGVANIMTRRLRDQMVRVTVKTQGAADLTKLEQKMALFKKFAKFEYPGFSSLTLDIKAGKLSGANLVYTFDKLRTEIMRQLKMTSREADTILKGIFGKKYTLTMPKVNTKAWDRLPTEFERNTSLVVKVAKRDGTNAAKQLIAGFTQGNRPAPYSVSTAKAAAAIREKLDTLPGYGSALGANLANSVAAGISSATSTVALRAEQMVRRAMQRANAAAESRSPSRVMMRLGVNIGIGLALGITSTTRAVVNASTKVANAAANALARGLRGKRSKRVKRAAERSSAVGTLVDFVNSMTEALRILADVKVPSLAAGWKANVRKIVSMANAVANEVAKAIIKAYRSEKSKRTKRVKRAAEVVGPLATIVEFVSSITEALKNLQTVTIPSAAADLRGRGRAVAQQVIAIASTVAAEIEATFAASSAERARLLDAAAMIEPMQSVVSLVSDSMSALQTMTDVDPHLFEVPDGAIQRMSRIVRELTTSVSEEIASITVPDTVLDAASRLQTLAQALMSVLDVMRGVAEISAGSLGDAGWKNMIDAANGMVSAASALNVGGGVIVGPYVLTPAGATAAGDTYNINISGPINARSETEAKAAANQIAQQTIHALASAKRKARRG